MSHPPRLPSLPLQETEETQKDESKNVLLSSNPFSSWSSSIASLCDDVKPSSCVRLLEISNCLYKSFPTLELEQQHSKRGDNNNHCCSVEQPQSERNVAPGTLPWASNTTTTTTSTTTHVNNNDDIVLEDDAITTSDVLLLNEEEEDALQQLLSGGHGPFSSSSPTTTTTTTTTTTIQPKTTRTTTSSLVLSQNLGNLTEETLTMIRTNPQLQSLYLDHIVSLQQQVPTTTTTTSQEQQQTLQQQRRVLLLRRQQGVEQDDNDIMEEPESEPDPDMEDAPDVVLSLYESSSHNNNTLKGTMMVLEQLEEALANNSSLTQVTLLKCHPKVVETVLWGISCLPSNLIHLTLELSIGSVPAARSSRSSSSSPSSRHHGRHGRTSRYLIWEGLVEILKNSRTLETLLLGNCQRDIDGQVLVLQEDVEDDDDDDYTDDNNNYIHHGMAVNWPLLAQGMEQNTTLTSLTLETLQWTESATTLLAHALSKHPYLANSEFVYHDHHSTLVTIRQQRKNHSSSTSRALFDATNTNNYNHVMAPSTAATFSTSSLWSSHKAIQAVVSNEDLAGGAAAAAGTAVVSVLHGGQYPES